MSDLIVANKSDLVAVADAIRTKAGSSESLSFPDGFVNAIGGISSGGGSSSGGCWLPVMNDGALMGEEVTITTSATYLTQGFTKSDNGQYLVTIDGVVYLGSNLTSGGIAIDGYSKMTITFTVKDYVGLRAPSGGFTCTLKLERWSEDGT